MDRRPHIRVQLDIVPTEEGGRHSPVFNHYRGQFHHLSGEVFADVEWLVPDEPIEPGTSSPCEVWFADPDAHLPRIRVGDSFEVREGRRMIGRGSVTEIL